MEQPISTSYDVNGPKKKSKKPKKKLTAKEEWKKLLKKNTITKKEWDRLILTHGYTIIDITMAAHMIHIFEFMNFKQIYETMGNCVGPSVYNDPLKGLILLNPIQYKIHYRFEKYFFYKFHLVVSIMAKHHLLKCPVIHKTNSNIDYVNKLVTAEFWLYPQNENQNVKRMTADVISTITSKKLGIVVETYLTS